MDGAVPVTVGDTLGVCVLLTSLELCVLGCSVPIGDLVVETTEGLVVGAMVGALELIPL